MGNNFLRNNKKISPMKTWKIANKTLRNQELINRRENINKPEMN